MKDWEDIIKERQLSRKAELPESDWNDFLSRKAAHERAAIRRRKIITAAISIPAAAAVLLLLFLMPFKKAVPDNRTAQNNQPEQQVITDSVSVSIDSITIEKQQVEIAQVKPQVKPEGKPDVEPKVNTEVKSESKSKEKPEVKPEVRTGMTFGGATGFGGSTSQHYGSRMIAQNTGSVKGRIYDFDSTEPMYPASLLVYQITGTDSTFVRVTTTDEDGSFVIDSLGTGNYFARATYIGFHDSDKNFTISSGDATEDLGDIALRYDEMYAQNIQAIVSKVSTGGMNDDTTMFNMTAYKLPEGTSVEELIRKLPGVQIDSAGNITVNGKSVSRILVNGKEFFNDDKTKSLTQLTAEMIEKVKAYEKNSDLSRQTGIDDGREEPVMELQFVGMLRGITSTFKIPLILYDGEVVDVPEDKVRAFDFSNSYNDRDSLSNLLGVRRGKINVVNAISGEAAVAKWGPSAENGVLQVMSGRYYRKSLRAGKLLYGTYEFIPRTKRSK